MSNTYYQITIHSVFAVRNRESLIIKEWREDLHRYISGIIKGEGAKPLAVGGWKDHIHILLGLPVNLKISDLVGAVKANSSRWINEQRLVVGKFHWQSGYGVFSYSKDQRPGLINYIMNQEEHHSNTSFKKEYLGLLRDFEIEYEEKYLFDFLEE